MLHRHCTISAINPTSCWPHPWAAPTVYIISTCVHCVPCIACLCLSSCTYSPSLSLFQRRKPESRVRCLLRNRSSSLVVIDMFPRGCCLWRQLVSWMLQSWVTKSSAIIGRMIRVHTARISGQQPHRVTTKDTSIGPGLRFWLQD